MNFYKMDGGEWSGTTTPATTANIQPLEGFLVNNTSGNTVHIYLGYEDSNPGEQFFTKMLDVGWNIVGVADLSFEADSEDYTEISVKNAFSSIKDQPSNIIDYTTDDFGGNDNSNEIDSSSQRYSTPETDTEKFEEFKAYPVFVRQAVKYSGSSTNKPTSPVEINGSLTVTKSSTPASGTVVKGAQDVPLISLTMAAGSAFDVKVTEMIVRIRADDDTVFNADQIAASDYINNIELWVDDVKIAEPEDLTLVGSVADGYYKATFSNMDYTITAGETIQVIVKGDISSNVSSTIYVAADIDPNSDDITCEDSNGDKIIATGASSINNSTSPNPVITVVLSSLGTLIVTKSSTPVSDIAVKGAQDVSLLGLTIAAGAASDVKISKMVVRLYANDNTDFNDGGTASSAAGTGGLSANDYVSNIELWAGGTKIAGPKGMSLTGTITGAGYYYATFDDMDYTVDAGSTIQIVVKGDLSSNVSSTTYLTADIDPDNDITAEDVGGNNVTAGGTNNLNLATNPNPMITVIPGGSLTIAVDADTPKENIMVAGTSDVAISKFKFTTTDEAFVVKKLSINNRQSGVAAANIGDYDNNIVSVKINYTNSSGATETKTGYLTNGTANFSGLDMLIDKNDDAVLTVSANLNTVAAGAAAGEFVDLNIAFNNFEAVAQGSGETYNGGKFDQDVAAASDLDWGTITWTDPAALDINLAVAALASPGSAQTIVVDNASAATPINLPVGTLLCVSAGTTCTTSTDSVLVVTGWTEGTDWTDGVAGDTVTTVVLDNVNTAFANDDDILYALPGTGYLTNSNHMHVYESKPTIALSSSSPSGNRTMNASDGIFVFTISADAQEKIQFQAAQVNDCTLISTDFQAAALAGAWNGVNVDTYLTTGGIGNTAYGRDTIGAGGAVGMNFSFDTDADLSSYEGVSLWLRSSEAVATTLTITDTIGGADKTTAVTPTAATWTFLDFPFTSTVKGAANINVDDVASLDLTATLAGAGTFDVDRVVLYTEKIVVDIAADADIDTGSGGTDSGELADELVAYLKEGGSTVATGYVYSATQGATDSSSAVIHFYPVSGTDSTIEISKGTYKTFTVQIDSGALLDADSGSDDPLTVSMALGSSTGGTVTPGGIWWNETNATVQWLGQVSNTTLNGNTLKY